MLTMTAAHAKRVAARLASVRTESFNVTYRDVLRALEAEHVPDPPAAVSALMHALRDAKFSGVAEVVADACAREASKQRTTLNAVRNALALLGVTLDGDVS